jgi:hypothetical protein
MKRKNNTKVHAEVKYTQKTNNTTSRPNKDKNNKI